MKKELLALAILLTVSITAFFGCNDGMYLSDGTVVWKWSDIPDQAQSAILGSGIDTSQVIVYGNLNATQKSIFLELGRDSTLNYKIEQ